MLNEISRFSSVVEHFLGKEEVMGSNPINGSQYYKPRWFNRQRAGSNQVSDAQFS